VTLGVCDCPTNYAGSACERCASGYSGDSCEVSSNPAVTAVIVILGLIGTALAIFLVVFLFKKRRGANVSSHRGASLSNALQIYSMLPVFNLGKKEEREMLEMSD
jgi:hypothetical protein